MASRAKNFKILYSPILSVSVFMVNMKYFRFFSPTTALTKWEGLFKGGCRFSGVSLLDYSFLSWWEYLKSKLDGSMFSDNGAVSRAKSTFRLAINSGVLFTTLLASLGKSWMISPSLVGLIKTSNGTMFSFR